MQLACATHEARRSADNVTAIVVFFNPSARRAARGATAVASQATNSNAHTISVSSGAKRDDPARAVFSSDSVKHTGAPVHSHPTSGAPA